MVNQKLKNIFLLTLIPIFMHGFEEIMTGFPNSDIFIINGGDYFNMSSESFYWIFHTLFWTSLPLLYLLFHKKPIAIWLFSLFGVFFIFELHHIIKAVYFSNYYPGLLTALIYPFIGIFYWKELIFNWRKYGK